MSEAWVIRFESDGSVYFEDDRHPERPWRAKSYREAAEKLVSKGLHASGRIVPAPPIEASKMTAAEAWEWMKSHPQLRLRWSKPTAQWVVGTDAAMYGASKTRVGAIRAAAKNVQP